MPRQKSTIPADVIAVRDALRSDGTGLLPELAAPLRPIAEALIRTKGTDADKDDAAANLARMWVRIIKKARRKRPPGLLVVPGQWPPPASTSDRVFSFLRAIQHAQFSAGIQAPPDPQKDALAARIRAAGASLTSALRDAGIADQTIGAIARRLFGQLAGDLWIGTIEERALHASLARLYVRLDDLTIEAIAERAADYIAPKAHGNQGGAVKARAFVRALARKNRRTFGEPLQSVIATACNALHDTNYTRQTVADILNPEARRQRRRQAPA